MKHFIGGSVLAVLAGLPSLAAAQCPDASEMQALAAQIVAGEPVQSVLAGGSLEDTLCAQGKLVSALEAEWGPPIGYKAGLTSAATQERFGTDAPVRGVLLKDMMLQDGASVPARFGARPLFEADLIVVVADAAINDAKTPVEVAASLSAIHPFIELPDLAVAEGQPIDAAVLTALNVGARLGVLGEAIPVSDPAMMAAYLSELTVIVRDGDGAELSSAPGSAVLGHPLYAVPWLVASGVTLKPGDLVSVGSIGPLLPPEPGLSVTATYLGLPGEPSVSVSFE